MDGGLHFESFWRRGLRDTGSAIKSIWFWAIEVIGGVALQAGNASWPCTAIFLVGILFAIWGALTIAAPKRQRDEHRSQLLAVKNRSDFEEGGNFLQVMDHGERKLDFQEEFAVNFSVSRYHKVKVLGKPVMRIDWPQMPGFQSGYLEIIADEDSTISWRENISFINDSGGAPELEDGINVFELSTSNSGSSTICRPWKSGKSG